MVRAEEKKANQLKEMREERAQMLAEDIEDNYYEPQEEDVGLVNKKAKLNIEPITVNKNSGRKAFVASSIPIAQHSEGVELLNNSIQTKETGILS